MKAFADQASIFTIAHDPTVTRGTLNQNLTKAFQWVHQLKVLFDPDSSKQATAIVFSRKNSAISHGSMSFNKMIISRRNVLKRLGLLLDLSLPRGFLLAT